MLAVDQLSHIFHNGSEETQVLNNIMVALLGSSGSGKSTLLNLMAGLMKPTRGSILIAGQAFQKMNENTLPEFRRSHIGFIFQSYELIPHLTVRENVELPMVFKGVKDKERKIRAISVLEKVAVQRENEGYYVLVESGPASLRKEQSRSVLKP